MNKTLIAGLAAAAFVISICIWGWNHRTANETVFESINVLFSGLAFAVLIITVLMQKEELELQRKELKDTRAEFEQQNSTMKRQRFENTFFNLLSTFNAIRGTVGYAGFQVNYKAVEDSIVQDDVIKGIHEIVNEAQKNHYLITMRNAYDKMYRGQIKATMNLYYKNFFNTQDYINSSDLVTDKEREFYMNIFYSQLMNFEVSLTSFHLLLSEADFSKEAEISKKYGLTKRLDIGLQFTDKIPIVFQYKGFDTF